MAVLPIGINPATGGGGAGGYQIERSLRFNSADSAYLNRTPASASNRRTFTLNFWAKLTGTGIGFFIAATGASGNNMTSFYWRGLSGTAKIEFEHFNGTTYNLTTDAVFRDPSAWYMITVAVDTTQATAANRTKIYVNNVQQTVTGSYVPQNTDLFINNNTEQDIGAAINANAGRGSYFNGYMTEVNFIDGSVKTPSDFGETDSATGVWKPKAYTGTYGTNGFFLKFADNSGTTSTTLGKDSSGNSNNWTPNNFSVTAGAGNDSLVDSPTAYGTDTGVGGQVRGNYCTLNPILSSANITFSNGNLDAAVGASSGVYRTAGGTIAISSGKWYFESIAITPFANSCVGVGDVTQSKATWESDTTTNSNFWFVNPLNGNKINGSGASYGSAYSNGDIINCAIDMDNGKIWWGKNGTWFASGDPAAGTNAAYTNLSGKTVTPAYFGGSSASGGATHTANFGQRAFAYTAPSGFKALCTTNLPTPTIGATSTTQANDYFNAVTYTGTGATQSITNVGFQPDFIWFKARSAAESHRLADVIRGAGKVLYSNLTNAEATESLGLQSFDSGGFTLGTGAPNTSAVTYVAWNWNAGGSNATNTSGTITSTVRANTTSGFSIVTYTGNGTNGATFGHGLGVVPAMIIIKARNAVQGWLTYHRNMNATPQNGKLWLHLTNAYAADSSVWNNTAPTSTLITLGTGSECNGNTNTYVAYCFAPVAGYSAFGSFTGNGSADGPFVYTGFRPKWVMVKSSTSIRSWIISDGVRNPYNVTNLYLLPNLSDAEATNNLFDFTSNGFKVRDSIAGINESSQTFIYAAFAETPAKFSLAR